MRTIISFISAVGPDAPLSYNGLADIDHVMSDSFAGDCVIPGVTDGGPQVVDATYFDHAPIVCELSPR